MRASLQDTRADLDPEGSVLNLFRMLHQQTSKNQNIEFPLSDSPVGQNHMSTVNRQPRILQPTNRPPEINLKPIVCKWPPNKPYIPENPSKNHRNWSNQRINKYQNRLFTMRCGCDGDGRPTDGIDNKLSLIK